MIFNYPILEKTTVLEFLESFYISKSKIYTLFLENMILVNNHKCKREDVLKKGDTVSVIQEEELDYKPKYGTLDIAYEDDYFLILNKPKGIIIHDGKDKDDSLSNLVAGYYAENGISLNVRFAHRLDTDTTGIIIFCKDLLTHSYMNHFIETHDIRRTYRALISGKMKEKNGSIDFAIGEDRHSKNKMRVSETGKKSVTWYETLKTYSKYSLVECKLETGRKHQIRVHFSHMGHPLLGDTLYGGDTTLIKRCALHSYSVEFMHPVYKEMLFVKAELPSDMQALLK